MMKAKLHKATVTEANLNYVGSITIDQDLLDQVDILPQEKVQVVNNNNGARLETYVIPGERGSGVICLNGAAARLVQPGDTVIVISYAMVEEKELNQFRSKVAIMDKDNRIAQLMNQEVHGTIPTV
nr:aspartate 1-decarboxylase [Caldalkalibacillus salinus]